MDDWRLRGQEKYLFGKKLYHIRFRRQSNEWDHEHCAFCFEKFSELDGDLHEGYCTSPDNGKSAYWVCENCFMDFKKNNSNGSPGNSCVSK